MPEGALKELAYYFPNPYWADGGWIKNLIIYFDGVSLLVPAFAPDLPFEKDPIVAAALKEEELLTVLEPEPFIDQPAVEELADCFVQLITTGRLDKIAKENSALVSLSRSRLGYMADPGLAQLIFDELKKRGS